MQKYLLCCLWLMPLTFLCLRLYAQESIDPPASISHTHPYNKSDGSLLGATFSAGDISQMRNFTSKGAGFANIVEAGTKRFATVITDAKKAEAFFAKNTTADLQKQFDKVANDPKNSKLSYQERWAKAIKKIVGNNSGLKLYETTDKEKHKFKKS